MRVLITRPEPDAETLSEIITSLGHEPIVMATMRIVFKEISEEDHSSLFGQARGILLTSANGIRALASSKWTHPYSLPCFAIGEATAKAASALGYDVEATGSTGDVSGLIQVVKEKLSPNDDRFLIHVAGSVQAGDLAGELTQLGYHVKRLVAYEMVPTRNLSEQVQSAFESKSIDAIMFYSARTVKLFAEMVREKHHWLANVKILCLSQNVAKSVQEELEVEGDVDPSNVLVAANPTQDDLLKLLQ